jgi:hypothetical protein
MYGILVRKKVLNNILIISNGVKLMKIKVLKRKK